jgi:APA family basic amino acid/polyamine antiporter
MVVGTIIGASIFVQPSEITGDVPSLAGTALVWIVAGGLTLMGALVTAELASMMPESGGVYAFLREAWGRPLGFLWGWAMFWTMHTGIIAAIAVVFARYLAFLLPLGDTGTRVVAVGAVLLLSAVNYVGVRHGSNLQTAFTLVKVLAILLMVAVGFALGGSGDAMTAAGPQPAVSAVGRAARAPVGTADALLGGASAADFLRALVAALFAFGGWHMVTYNAEETVDPRRTVPRALGTGVLLVTACYVLLNAVYFHVLPLSTVVASERVAADAADAVAGSGGGAFMAALVVFSTFGALAGIVLAGPRVYWAMARDRMLFRWVGGLHPRYRTPHRAIALQAVWASALVLTGTYRALFTRVVYTEWIFFGVMALGVYVLRARGVEGPYRTWGYPVTPALFAGAAFAIVVNQVVHDPAESALGLGMVLVGLPVYLFWGRQRRSDRSEARPP